MDTLRICPECRKPLAPNAPEGICPECLIKAGLGTGIDLGPESRAASGGAPFTAPTPEDIGRLFPQLEVLGFIGQGGMGAVYQARQKALERVVALKILPPGIGKDPAFAERFTREAKALAKLNHPGIVTLYEFGKADGLFFFLMEYVDGVTLRQLLQGERISAREALAIVPQICDALQYAHDHGIVHRDIKPENILLDRQGRVKVADFGLAKLVGVEAAPSGASGGAPPASALTDAGRVMGTPSYMAPEQREHPTEVDHRADIYSLGVVFYQMLTGELPDKRLEPPSKKVQIDVRLDEVVMRALERKPELRYQQASILKTEVETIASEASAGTKGERRVAKPFARRWFARLRGGESQASGTPPTNQGPPGGADVPPLQPTAPGRGNESRFSRLAIVGACWAPLFFVVVLMTFSVRVETTGEHHGPAWWQYLLMFTVLPAGVLAPFGTTILGWIAAAQIRRSGGKLYGLGLAVFDGLLFPLLTLTGLIAWFWWWLIHDVICAALIEGHPQLPPLARMVVEDQTGFCALATVASAGVLGFFIVRAVWRAVNRTVEPGMSGAAAPDAPTTRKPIGWMLLALVLVALLAAALVFALSKSGSRTEAVIDGLPALQPETPGVLGWRYKCSVPPDHSLLFTVVSYESNGVASIDQELSSYVTMGPVKERDFTYELTRQDGAMLSPELRDSYRWNKAFRTPSGGVEMAPQWRKKDQPEGGWSILGKRHFVLRDGDTYNAVLLHPFRTTPEQLKRLELRISLHKLPKGVNIGPNCSMNSGTGWLEAAQRFSNRRKGKGNASE